MSEKTGERRVYLDTSAYLAILLGEKGASAISRDLRGAILCSSTLLLLEAERNLVRLARERLITEGVYELASDRLHADHELFLLRDLTLDLCVSREFPAARIPRSSDLAHLRTARWFQAHGGLSRFVSLDREQLKAASEFGLPA